MYDGPSQYLWSLLFDFCSITSWVEFKFLILNKTYTCGLWYYYYRTVSFWLPTWKIKMLFLFFCIIYKYIYIFLHQVQNLTRKCQRQIFSTLQRKYPFSPYSLHTLIQKTQPHHFLIVGSLSLSLQIVKMIIWQTHIY